MPLISTVYTFRHPTGELSSFKITQACRDSYYPECFLLTETAEVMTFLLTSDYEALLERPVGEDEPGVLMAAELVDLVEAGECQADILTVLMRPREVPGNDLSSEVNVSAAERLTRQAMEMAKCGDARKWLAILDK